MKYLKNIKLHIASFVVLLLTAIVSFSFVTAYAIDGYESTDVSLGISSPSTYLEYYALTSPIDVSATDNYFAVAESDRISVYDKLSNRWLGENNQGFTWEEANEIKQIETVGETLYLLDSGLNLWSFSFTAENPEPLNLNIPCAYFSANENYLAVSQNGQVRVYDRNDLSVYSATVQTIDKTAVIINDDYLYYFATGTTNTVIKRSGIIKSDGEIALNYDATFGLLVSSTLTIATNVKYVTVYENVLYMTVTGEDNANVTAIELSDKGTAETAISADKTSTDFSVLKDPQGLCTYEGVLFVADKNENAVKGYSPENYEYADICVATEVNYKTRLYSVTDVAVREGVTYTLETEKLSVIKNGKITDSVRLGDIGEISFTPNMLCAGDKYALIANSSCFAFIDLKTKLPVMIYGSTRYDNYETNISVCDVSFSDGYFYVLKHTNNDFVARYSEENLLTESPTSISVTENAKKMTVDIEGNIYVYTDNGTNRNVYFYGAKDGSVTAKPLSVTAKKIQVDLSGNLYLLKYDNKLAILKKGEDSISEYGITVNENLPQSLSVNSFALDYYDSNAYFSFDGKGLIAKSPVVLSCVTNVKIPDALSLTSASASDDITFLKLQPGTKIFNFDVFKLDGTTFSYVDYETYDGESLYIKIGETELFDVLLGKTACFVKKSNAVVAEAPFKEAKITKVYTITTAGVYNYPLLFGVPTDGDPTVWDNKSSPVFLTGAEILDENTILTVIKTVDFNGRNFSYVSYETENGVVYAYVYTGLTSGTLMEDLALKNYRYEKISVKNGKVAVYAQDLETVITYLSQDVKVKVLGEENGYRLVHIEQGDNLVIGYVSEKAFSQKGKNALRNTLIFVLLATSVAVTSIYLIYRLNREKRY